MRITIDIPDWAAERHISIMAGMELIAYKPYGKDILLIKTSRCSECGWCCLNNLPEPCPHVKKVGKVYSCSLGLAKPWNCCWADPILTKNPIAEQHCSIRYEEVEI